MPFWQNPDHLRWIGVVVLLAMFWINGFLFKLNGVGPESGLTHTTAMYIWIATTILAIAVLVAAKGPARRMWFFGAAGISLFCFAGYVALGLWSLSFLLPAVALGGFGWISGEKETQEIKEP